MKRNNPIVRGMGVCDPHIHIFNNRAYLYASHDTSPENKTWIMTDWQIWSSPDLVTWNYESTVKPEETYIGPCDRCWAVDAAERNGKYYYYFSNGNKDTGVAVGDTPVGPFRDPLGKPLLPENFTEILQYDPTVFVDPDTNIPYLIWGHSDGDGYNIARLNEDMISLAEKPRLMPITGSPRHDDKNFLHKKNGIYYLTWGSHYATSNCIYGPYTYRGNLGVSEDHGSFFSWNGQDFFAYTIFDPYVFYRATGICYIHYKENGEMVADQMAAEFGVGVYDGNWNKIRAQWFMQAKYIEKRENMLGNFDICSIEDKSELIYPNIQNMKNKKKIHFLVSSWSEESYIEVWDRKKGKQIGLCKVTRNNDINCTRYGVFSCELDRNPEEDELDLLLKFSKTGDNLIRLTWFRFTE